MILIAGENSFVGLSLTKNLLFTDQNNLLLLRGTRKPFDLLCEQVFVGHKIAKTDWH